jgi:hypothetical protein
MQSLKDLQEKWTNTLEFHKSTNELFEQLVNNDIWLKHYRDEVEGRVLGFGQRSFTWLFHLIIKELPDYFKACEIGVFSGATTALVGGLALQQNKKCDVYGVSTFDGLHLNWKRDFLPECIKNFNEFTEGTEGINFHPIKGLSQDKEVIEQVNQHSYDLLYVDGSHEYDDVIADILNYCPLVKVGGYVLFDDSASAYPMPFGYFCGILSVSQAVDTYFPIYGSGILSTGETFIQIGSVMHLRLFQRVS